MGVDAVVLRNPTQTFAEVELRSGKAVVLAFALPAEGNDWQQIVRTALGRSYPRKFLRSIKFRQGTFHPITPGA